MSYFVAVHRAPQRILVLLRTGVLSYVTNEKKEYHQLEVYTAHPQKDENMYYTHTYIYLHISTPSRGKKTVAPCRSTKLPTLDIQVGYSKKPFS